MSVRSRDAADRLIVVTNRRAAQEPLPVRMEGLARGGVRRFLLREKDLPVQAYRTLAAQCRRVCAQYGAVLLLHTHREQGEPVQLPFPAFCVQAGMLTGQPFGVSVHSPQEAAAAQAGGAAWVIAGHIFPTVCKPGLPPRGLDFLKQICAAVEMPVYAIGGITPERVPQVLAGGAYGVCTMTAAMTCADPAAYAEAFLTKLKNG